MATLIPSLSQCLPRMTSGEKAVARLLEGKLEDDYQPWYDVPLAGGTMKPDFIVLNPRRGVLVLEVKDWNLDTLVSIDAVQATIRVEGGEKVVTSPLAQVRGYAQDLKSILERDPQLTNGDGPYRGRLVTPWGYGIVFSRLTRKQFADAGIGEAIPEDLVICRDELSEEQSGRCFRSASGRCSPGCRRRL